MPPKKKVANGYKFAEPLPKGSILEDIGKKKWKLGPSIGKGGFGEIYSAQEAQSQDEKYNYVIKIEPHSNGPLFVEINFYIRHAKPVDIENFKKEKGLKTFGMPIYHGSGSHEYNGQKYRFLVIDKFSTDLSKLYLDSNKVFPSDTVFKLGIQILDVLEYIHSRGYVHADIKAANLMLGATKETQNKQVYLVDFGLATKYSMDKEFKPNPKKAHDGTIEFLSRDAHQGVQTRRGDLEILAYNLIHWLGCKLPWEEKLSDPKVVQNKKEECMATVSKMIKASFDSRTPPNAIVEFLNYIKTLKFNTEPNYKKIRAIFASGVKECGGSIDTPLQFSKSKTPVKRTRTPLRNSRSKKTKVSSDEKDLSIDENETYKVKKRRIPKKDEISVDEENSMELVEELQNGDDLIENTKRKPKNTTKIMKKKLPRKAKSLENLSTEINFEGYTEAMKEVILKKNKKGGRKKHVEGNQKEKSPSDKIEEDMTGYTEEMKAIALKKMTKQNEKKKNNERGLVKLNSNQVQKKTGLKYTKVVSCSEGSESD